MIRIARSLLRTVRVLVVLAIAASSLTSRAGGLADEAELQFQLGAERYQKGEFRDALEHFLASNRLVSNKNVVFNIARTYEQLGRFADAHRYYVDALEVETAPQTVGDIRAAIQRIAPNVAVLRVETTPPGATLYIDRKDLGSRGRTPRLLAVPEGTYQVIVELDGYEAVTSAPIAAKLGAETRVPIALRRIVGAVHVDVVGAPAAAVRVDDERAPAACSAPCDLDLAPGQHQLYFAREGFVAPSQQILVRAGEASRATATLSPLTGSIMVSADEREALIEIDGSPSGFTPAVIQSVAVGRRHVRVTRSGYAPVERDVDVKTGEQVGLLGLSLTPLREVAAASRFVEAIEDAPSSVSILERQELRAFGYPTIAEALRGVRGVYLSNDGAYFSAGVRGLGEPNDYGNRLLVLSDGQSLNDDIVNSSYIGSDGRADLHDVDRIEIVRGPGSLLYGTGAFSGVINLVPPPRDEPTSVHVSGGTYDEGVVRGRAGFHYNGGPSAGISASVSAAREDGHDLPIELRSPGDGPAVLTAHDVDWFRSVGTAGRAWLGDFTAQWFFHTRTQHIPVGIADTIFDDTRTLYRDTRMMAEVRWEPKPSDRVQVLVRAHANRYLFHGDYAYQPTPNVEDYAGTWFGTEARFVVTPYGDPRRLRLTFGGEVQAHVQADMEGTNGSGSYLDAHHPYNFGAAYALLEASPKPWLRVSAGARIDVYSTFGPIAVPRVALIFRPALGSTVKIMSGRAFRAPSVYEQFYEDGTTQVPGVDRMRGLSLAPESVFETEIEASQRFREDWVALVAGHVSYVQGLIDSIPDRPGSAEIRYANNPSPAFTAGLDVELRHEWRQGWMVGAMYGVQTARSLAGGTANPRLINAPEHLASLRGVIPLWAELASLGVRATLEAPRRISVMSDDLTPTAVVADLTLSGGVKRFGVGYVFGIYNAFDSRYGYPVTDTNLSRTLRQSGRTFLADLTLTYP